MAEKISTRAAPNQPHRLIDDVPYARKKPMRVLALGLSRTGTSSLQEALKILGYSTYHMSEVYYNKERDSPLWLEAIKAKFYYEGTPYTPHDIDKILDKYDAVLDAPSNLFWKEMLEAFPDAKVVLTVRDMDQWLASNNKTIANHVMWKGEDVFPYFQPSLRSLREMLVATWCVISGNVTYRKVPNLYSPKAQANLKQWFVQHYAEIKETVPKERILEYRVQEGWEPLCEWLGQEVPAEPFPHVNDTKAVLQILSTMYWMNMLDAVAKTAVGVGVVGVGIALWFTGKWRRFF